MHGVKKEVRELERNTGESDARMHPMRWCPPPAQRCIDSGNVLWLWKTMHSSLYSTRVNTVEYIQIQQITLQTQSRVEMVAVAVACVAVASRAQRSRTTGEKAM